MRSDLPVVAHYTGTFLPVTEGWIHDQLRFISEHRPIVLSRRRANADLFPWRPVYAVLDVLSAPARLINVIGRVLRGYYPYHRNRCRDEKAVLLHAHFGNRGVIALPLARALGIPLVTSFYGRDMALPPGREDAVRRWYQTLFAEGALFLAEGPAARGKLIALGCPPAKVGIHRLGIDPSEYRFEIRRRRPGEPLRILMAGRFAEKKGFIHGVHAFCRVARETPLLELTIVGDAGPTPSEQRQKRMMLEAIARSGMTERVTWIASVDLSTLMTLARRHHVILQPSVTASDGDTEGGHPVVLTQMAASGMPAIATRHCDIPEVVAGGRTGWLCEEGNEEQLAGAIREAFADLALLPRYSENARLLVLEKYDLRRHTLDTVYASVLQTGDGGLTQQERRISS